MNFFATLLADTPLQPISQGPEVGPWWGILSGDEAANILAGTIISNMITVMTLIAGVYFIFQVITGAYNFMAAGEDSEKVKKAKRSLSHSILGLIVVVASYALVWIVGDVLGFDIINIQETISNLKP